MTEIGKDILKLLVSYDISNYPLQFMHIYCRLKENTLTNHEIAEELSFLTNKLNYKTEGQYLPMNVKAIINKEIEAKSKAFAMIVKAYKNAFIISKFPFVRAVFLSGSIMKGYADENSYIDYFIVTKENRLWISRALLVIYKKLFLRKSKKHFCLNYFKDERDLEIHDKDLFTATELINLVPVYNYDDLSNLFLSNSWILRYYNRFPVWKENEPLKLNYFYKKVAELILDNRLGNALDNLILKLSTFFIKKKLQKSKQLLDFEVYRNIRLNKHECKYHRHAFRQSILKNYNLKKAAYGDDFNISMN
jgi:predicted nucleotidyltransferase